MAQTRTFLLTLLVGGLTATPTTAEAGWQGRRAKCVKPDNEITEQQQQSLSAAVRGGTVVWNAAGSVDQASASASTNQVLSQGAYDQAWIRYELCVARDNNLIDQATYNRLLEQSLMNSMGSGATPAVNQPAPVTTQPVASTPAASTGGSTGSTGTEWQQQIQAQTQLRSGENYANMASYGFSLMDVASTGLLDASTSTNVPVSLSPGYDYAIMGVCDNDCSDLDLTVLKSGVQLAVDTSRDDWPVVQVTPTGTGDYSVQVSMYQCSTKNCGYQLTVWRRTAQAAAPTASTPEPASNSGGSVQGTLGDGDHTLPNGEWADVYTIDVQAGQTITASMSAGDIDTYLVAQAPSGANEGNDDCEGDRTRSCLNITAQEGGEWKIYATSYEANDSGTYQLDVSVQ